MAGRLEEYEPRDPRDSPDHDEESPLLRPTSNDDTPVAQELPLFKLLIVLLSVWTGVFLASLDSTVISTLLAPIASEFQSFASLSWITTAYLIAQAAVQPLAGKLTDIYGRRTGLLTSCTLFTLGTALCGWAKSEHMMVAGRVIAGAGGGGLFSISSIVATDLVPLRKRGIAQGGGNIAYGTGAALGAVYGGVVSDRIGWRWAFLIQIPFILVSALFIAIYVNIPVRPTTGSRHKRIDYLGSLNIILFLTLFLLALNTGGTTVPWTHPLVLTSLPLSLLFLGGFIYTEQYLAREPIIPLTILTSRTVIASCLAFLFMVMSMFCAYFFLPIYSMLRGSTSTGAGVHLIPFPVGISIGSLGSGMIMNRTGRYYWLSLSSTLLFNLGIGLFCSFDLNSPEVPQYLSLLFFGTGYGATLTVGLVAMIAAVKLSQQATTTSASYLFRSAGGTMGAAAGAAVFRTSLMVKLRRLGDSDAAREIIERVLRDFTEVRKVPEPWKEVVVEAYMGSLRMVFLASLGFGVLAILAVGAMKEHKLHSTLDRK